MKSSSAEARAEFAKLEDNKTLSFEEVLCYQCLADDFSTLLIGQDDLTGKKGNFRYVKCNRCEFVYLNPRVAVSDIKHFYDDDYVAHDRRTKGFWKDLGMKFSVKQHDIKKEEFVLRHKTLTKDSEVLDIGCAIGTFLLHMHERHGCKVNGVDFKDLSNYPEAAAITSYVGLFYEQDFEGKKFDVITMWHFLEHCYNPRKSLQTAHQNLKEDGVVVIEVPRLDSISYYLQGKRWPGVQAPQHLTIFDRKHFIKMCESEGFEVVEYMPWGAFPPLFYLYFGFFFLFNNGKGINLVHHFIPYSLFTIIFAPFSWFQKYLNLSMQTIILRKKK